MGVLLSKWFNRDRFQPNRVKSVWTNYVCKDQAYFHKVVRNVCARDEGIKEALLSSSVNHAMNEHEQDFVLNLLGDRIGGFFHSIITEDVLYNSIELKRSCYNMGRQHASYSKDVFKLVWWDEFTLAMLEVLEDLGKVPRAELQAWQAILHVINENMLLGYNDARTAMSRKRFSIRK